MIENLPVSVKRALFTRTIKEILDFFDWDISLYFEEKELKGIYMSSDLTKLKQHVEE